MKYSDFFLSALLILAMGIGIYSTQEIAFASATEAQTQNRPFDKTSAQWDRLLKRFVTIQGATSQVEYRTWKNNQDELSVYLKSLESVTSAQFSSFSDRGKLVFLINAYNALTVKLVLDHYPVKSIRDLGGLFSSPWKIKFFRLFGEEHQLDDIEHEMIRKKFSEPRIHFALVCASKGCPALRNEAFTVERLDKQLDSAANGFLRDRGRNRFDSSAGILYLSSIFKWYGEDFDKKFGSVKGFVAPRIAKDSLEEALIKNEKTKISYLDYDWSLNEFEHHR